MRVTHPIVISLALCGAISASAAYAQTSTPPGTPAPPSQSTTPQKPVRPATPPPITTPPPDSALPPSAASTGLPPGNRTLQQQQQELRNGVQRNSTDSIRRNSSKPNNNANSMGQPASGSSTH